MSEKIVCITLCRKNSQRFPDKTRAMFLGKPLYMYTVDFAKKLGHPYIFAHNYNNFFYGRDKNLKEIKREERFSSSIHRTCEEIKSFGLNADIFIFLQVTSPLRDLNTVERAIDKFVRNKNYLCGLTVKRISDRYFYNGDKKEVNFSQSERTDNGCYKENIYFETGAFYIFRKEQLDKKHILDCLPEQKMFVVDEHGIDINTEEDLKRAEKEYRK